MFSLVFPSDGECRITPVPYHDRSTPLTLTSVTGQDPESVPPISNPKPSQKPFLMLTPHLVAFPFVRFVKDVHTKTRHTFFALPTLLHPSTLALMCSILVPLGQRSRPIPWILQTFPYVEHCTLKSRITLLHRRRLLTARH